MARRRIALNVAEKPSVAKGVAELLSRNSANKVDFCLTALGHRSIQIQPDI